MFLHGHSTRSPQFCPCNWVDGALNLAPSLSVHIPVSELYLMLSAEEKLHQEEEKLHQENVQRFKEESSAARRNACLSATGGVCLPGGGYAQQLVNKGKLHPCHQCGIQSALGRRGRVGGIAAFDRIIACQQKTQTPCD